GPSMQDATILNSEWAPSTLLKPCNTTGCRSAITTVILIGQSSACPTNVKPRPPALCSSPLLDAAVYQYISIMPAWLMSHRRNVASLCRRLAKILCTFLEDEVPVELRDWFSARRLSTLKRSRIKFWQVVASIEILQRSMDIALLTRSENVARTFTIMNDISWRLRRAY